jgi:hypothetical protein
MSDTPRTDRWLRNLDGWHYVNIERARELERELNEANDRIKRLEEAGDAILNANNDDEKYEAIKHWNNAKEAKP